MQNVDKMLLVRYGELTLKGNNKQTFIKKLEQNMKKIGLYPQVEYDYMLLNYSEENINKLQTVFGLSSFSIIYFTKPELEILSKSILNHVRQTYLNENLSFKVEAKRKDKSFGNTSDEIKRYVANEILDNTKFKVDVKNFDFKIDIRIEKNRFYFFTNKVELLKGLPLGISGKAIHLISGGFDSPVASFLMMKRGFEVEFVNFITPPHTDDLTVKKTKMILQELTKYQSKIKLHLIKFTDLMNYLGLSPKQNYKVVLMRRSFYRISQKIAEKNNSIIISNGENIGQVASQTAEAIYVIQSGIKIPIIRPLATFDKNEIIKISKEIKTHDISVIQSNEACELFAPKNPIIKPSLEVTEFLENELDQIEFLENKALNDYDEIFYFNYEFRS